MAVARAARRLAALAVAVTVSATVLAPTARASFSDAGSAALTISSATVEPASNLTVTTRCGRLLSFSAAATLSWTETPSTFAEGYTVERWRGSTLESATTVTPRTTTTLTQTGLATGTSYTWTLRAYVTSWTSPEVSVTASTPGPCL